MPTTTIQQMVAFFRTLLASALLKEQVFATADTLRSFRQGKSLKDKEFTSVMKDCGFSTPAQMESVSCIATLCQYGNRQSQTHKVKAEEMFRNVINLPLTQDDMEIFIQQSTNEKGIVSFDAVATLILSRGKKVTEKKTVDEQEMARLNRDTKSGVQYSDDTIAARLSYWQAQADRSALMYGVPVTV